MLAGNDSVDNKSGNVSAILFNFGTETQTLEVGERLLQMVLHKYDVAAMSNYVQEPMNNPLVQLFGGLMPRIQNNIFFELQATKNFILKPKSAACIQVGWGIFMPAGCYGRIFGM